MAPPTESAVEVVYALPGEQVLVHVPLAAGATVGEAIGQSGLLQRYPQIQAAALCAGVFGNRVAMDTRLNDGDRVEIYRPLTVDPKEARRRRVMLRTAGKTVG